MPLTDSIESLANANITVKRAAAATFVDGVKQAPSVTVLGPYSVTMQPGVGLNRVVGGADMSGFADGQVVTEVSSFNATVEIKERDEDNEPDIVVYKGKDWTVVRVEEWPDLDGGLYWHVVISRQTNGGT